MSTTKKVIVYSTVGGSAKTVETNAVNWGELQKDLDKQGVSYSGMKAVDGGSKVTFENPEGVLPEGDMKLFLFPVKTKSGAGDNGAAGMSFSALRAFIKDALALDETKAKAHFNKDKNYTNKSTDELRALVASYKVPGGKASSSVKTETPAASTTAVGKASKGKSPVAEVVASVARTKRTAVVEEKPAAVPAKAEKPEKPAIKADGVVTGQDGQIDHIIDLINKLDGSSAAKKDAIQTLNSLRPTKAGEVDAEALKREARELAKGLSGIKDVY